MQVKQGFARIACALKGNLAQIITEICAGKSRRQKAGQKAERFAGNFNTGKARLNRILRNAALE